jgi:cardiolipin synthase
MASQSGLKKFVSLFCLLYFFIISAEASGRLIVEPEQGRRPILEAIQKAQTTIDLAMYGFTDPELMQAFVQAKDQGKKVRILLQHYPYKSIDENELAIQRFSSAHVNLNYAPSTFYLLHQKTLVLDGRTAEVLTFNFTRSTFHKQRNFGLILTDPAEVSEIQQVFNADWQNKKFHPSQPNLIWSPDNSREKIVALIQSAKREIKVYAQGLTDEPVVDALVKAAERGVEVQIITSGSQLGKKWAYLQKSGVHCALDKKLTIHAKVLIVDREKAMLGSINFTQASLDKNRELSVIVKEGELIGQLLAVFARDWQASQSF